MSVAQKLYEGISLKNETVGLITYMRTDSIRLSDEFVADTYNYIENNYGSKYTGYIKNKKRKKTSKMLTKQFVQLQLKGHQKVLNHI